MVAQNRVEMIEKQYINEFKFWQSSNNEAWNSLFNQFYHTVYVPEKIQQVLNVSKISHPIQKCHFTLTNFELFLHYIMLRWYIYFFFKGITLSASFMYFSIFLKLCRPYDQKNHLTNSTASIRTLYLNILESVSWERNFSRNCCLRQSCRYRQGKFGKNQFFY